MFGENPSKKKINVFSNTWSVDGLLSEGQQPAELGWGTHEKNFPINAIKHLYGSKSSICLEKIGFKTKVKSWNPIGQGYLGYLITHNEAISLSDYFSYYDENSLVYRPTVYYAYKPSDDTLLSIEELLGKSEHFDFEKKLTINCLYEDGIDSLGVLLLKVFSEQGTIPSMLKHHKDVYVSTLQVYIRALGGELKLIVPFPEVEIKLHSFASVQL